MRHRSDQWFPELEPVVESSWRRPFRNENRLGVGVYADSDSVVPNVSREKGVRPQKPEWPRLPMQ